MRKTSGSRVLAIASVVLTFALSVTACGGDSGSASGGEGANGASSQDAGGNGSGEEGSETAAGDEIPDSLAEAETDEEIYIASAQMMLDGFGMDRLDADQKQCFMDHLTGDAVKLIDAEVEAAIERELRQKMFDDCGVEHLPDDR